MNLEATWKRIVVASDPEDLRGMLNRAVQKKMMEDLITEMNGAGETALQLIDSANRFLIVAKGSPNE